MACMHLCMMSSAPPDDQADWRLVRAFVAVMRTGNLTRAAHLLATTQPTVGRQIRELERLAGETYFLRRGNRLEPTEHARVMFARAVDVEGAVTALARDLAAPARAKGTVRLTTSTTFGVHLLPRILPALMRKAPGVEIEIIATDLVQNLHRRDVDVAIRLVAPTQPDLIARRMGFVSIGLYATTAYLNRHGRPLRPQDLSDHLLIADRDGSEIVAAANRLGIVPLPAPQTLRSDELLVRDGLMRAGLGIGTCHVWLADRAPELERVLPETDVARLPVWLIAHEDVRRSSSLRAVYDGLTEELQGLF